jgi:hypothetical protein
MLRVVYVQLYSLECYWRLIMEGEQLSIWKIVVLAYTTTPFQNSPRNIIDLKCTYIFVSQKVSGEIYFSVFIVFAALIFVHTEICDLVGYMP